MNKLYYLAVNGNRTGPFTINELKDKKIERSTLVWSEGMENWTKAELLPELKGFLRTEPPPIPDFGPFSGSGEKTQPNPTQQDEIKLHFGYQLASRSERFFASLVQTIVVLIPYFYFNGFEDFFKEEKITFKEILGDAYYGALSGAILGAIFYPFWQGNLGHRIFGLKVISAKSGKDVNTPWQGAWRESAKGFLSAFVLPAIWLLWDSKNQNLYDKVVETYVVRKK